MAPAAERRRCAWHGIGGVWRSGVPDVAIADERHRGQRNQEQQRPIQAEGDIEQRRGHDEDPGADQPLLSLGWLDAGIARGEEHQQPQCPDTNEQ